MPPEDNHAKAALAKFIEDPDTLPELAAVIDRLTEGCLSGCMPKKIPEVQLMKK